MYPSTVDEKELSSFLIRRGAEEIAQPKNDDIFEQCLNAGASS